MCPRCGKNCVAQYGPYPSSQQHLPYTYSCNTLLGGCGWWRDAGVPGLYRPVLEIR